MANDKREILVGGQAVIEGVMMRSPEYVTVAVRKPDGRIVLKKDPYSTLTKRIRFLGWPLIRGGVILIESMILGVKALNFSSATAMKEETSGKSDMKTSASSGPWTAVTSGLTLLAGFGLGLALFFYLPLVLTDLTGVQSGFMFNLIDGGIRMALFIIYLLLISRWKEIRRVFEYHGAEHKTIYAHEEKKDLTLDAVRPYTTHHPRCGTSFLLVVMVVSILVFMTLGRPGELSERFVRMLFIPVIGGISYEIIRISAANRARAFARFITTPGLWLQRITTREPDDDQLECAIVALRGALNLSLGDNVDLYQKNG